MKKQSIKSGKTMWQEFTEFMATIYWPGAEEDLPSERVEFEFESFKALVAG